MASTRQGLSQASRLITRALRTPTWSRSSIRLTSNIPRAAAILPSIASPHQRSFSACARQHKGIMPDTDNPDKAAPQTEEEYAVAELTDEEYHELSDEYMNDLLERFETHQDNGAPVDVEFSSGVMTITLPDKGIYVINKQPPNKQIWLSSPLSGPKRYDLCVISEGQGDKEGTARGHWIYTRDGSSLDELLFKEIEVTLGVAGNN